MEKIIAYKFVSHEVGSLDELKNSKVYILKEKLLNGEKLNREEKNWITEKVFCNTWSKHSIPLMGYMFRFKDFLKRYLCCIDGHWEEHFAFDKTSLRNAAGVHYQEIVEIPK